MSDINMQAFHNLLEPAALINYFSATPPQDFLAFELAGGVPAFSAIFDILTTLDPAVRRRIQALVLARWWSSWLRIRTCFVGTTVSEYALLPTSVSPQVFVRHLIEDVAPRYPLLIVKDIPTESVLVGNQAHAYSHHLIEACQKNGFLLVDGQALAYVPIDFPSIDVFLSRFSRSRRKDIRRKLKSTSDFTIEAISTGEEFFKDERTLDLFYALYLNVYRQSEIHFDLLSPGFFKALLQDASSRGIVVVYRVGSEIIGYNICFVENEALIDKYVGFLYPQAREHNLYAVSWFYNLEYARAHGLRYYIAGWTDPEIKRYLGARFTLTQHAVYVRNPVLKAILRPFKRFFESDGQWHSTHVSGTDS